ncbi:MAG: ribbon-helix-helix protein, CopG family [Ilumatobacteraceae bacterium]
MARPIVDRPAGSVTIHLSPEHLQRLDELCAERNVTRGHVIAELLDRVKHGRVVRRADDGRQKPNPWAQVWPGGKA